MKPLTLFAKGKKSHLPKTAPSAAAKVGGGVGGGGVLPSPAAKVGGGVGGKAGRHARGGQCKRRIYQLLLILLPCCFFYATLPAHAATQKAPLPVEQIGQEHPDIVHHAQLTESMVYISEFMASNGNTLADEDGDYPDWLELHNAGKTEVDLTGWYLTDNSNNLTKWQLPVTILGPGDYLLVFASDKDRDIAGAELHTDFKLASGGEYLALVQPDGTTVASAYTPYYPAQFRDVSYGLDASLNERYFTVPTPGAANGSGLADLGPIISSATHTPTLPTESDEITVAVTVTRALNPLDQVTLHYRVMFSETFTMTMRDDGVHGDGAANDGVYAATIPTGTATSGQMVRYYITAQDSEGQTSRYPFFQDATGSPEYFGTVMADSSINTQLPVLQWFISDTVAAETRTGTRASFFYDGTFYDNVFVRLRGGFSTSFPKKSFKIEFNEGAYFRFSPDQEPVDEFNLNTTYSDQSYIRPVLAFESYRDAGGIYSISFPMRVHRNGSFYSVALFVEQPDSTYLRRQGLDENGALYKVAWNVLDVVDNRIEKKRPKDDDTSDLEAFIDGIHLEADERTAYLFDHVNLPAVINYLATAFIMQDWDIVPRNYYLYRDTSGTGEWMVLPWDKDLTFGNTVPAQHSVYGHPLFGSSDYPATYADIEYWNHLTDALYDTPAIQQMYLRRLRTLMDQLLQPRDTPANELYYEARLAQFLAQMESDAEEDRAIWGSYWGDFQSFSSELFELERNFLRFRRRQLYQTHGPSGSGLIPEQQAQNVTIDFGPYEIKPTSGNPDEEYFTLVNPNPVAVDLSGWQVRLPDQMEYTLQAGVVIPAQGTLYLSPNVNAFRQRASSPTAQEALFVQGNYSAYLADTGGPLELYHPNGQLVATQNVGMSQLANKVIISELNYNPPSSTRTVGTHLEKQLAVGDEYEFVELKNIDSNAIDLSGFSFTQGISYTFPANTTLAPNGLLLLVRNPSEFANRYPAITSDGVYTGSLANEGERLTLVDTDGYIVTSFEYGHHALWPQSTNGQGHTLTRRTPAGLGSNPCRWLASNNLYGSPGVDEDQQDQQEDQNEATSGTAACQPADAQKIILTELNYNPLDEGAIDGDQFEFIELKNIYTMTVGLGEFYFTDGIDYTFPATMTVEPNEFILLAHNPTDFATRYPSISVDGHYRKNFANSGESVELTDDTGSVVISFTYDDQAPWPEATDREGYSLIRHDFSTHISNPCSWRASSNLHGSPKADEPAHEGTICATLTAERLMVSELSYHPADEGAIAGDEFEFIELYNAYTRTLNLADASFTKGISYTFPVTMAVEPNEFILLVRNPAQFMTRYPAISVDGVYHDDFSNTGESVELTNDTGNVIISFEYDEKAPWPEATNGEGYTLMPHDLTGDINNPCSWRASTNLYGSPKANEAPSESTTCVRPTREWLTVSELNYNPPDKGAIDGDEFEFIELYNAYTATLNLADSSFTEGISYTFPSSAAIGPAQYLLLVRNATEFNTRYPNVSVNHSYQGNLANISERLTLLDQDAQPIFSFIYSAQFPWPEEAGAGTGYTLTRYDMSSNPNESCSWRTSSDLYGSPGTADPLPNAEGCGVLYLPLLFN